MEASWCLKSLASPLFFNSLFKLTAKKNNEAVHYWSFVRAIHGWWVDSPKQGASDTEKVACYSASYNTNHYNDIIMGVVASQITSLAIVFSTVYSDADQRQHQSHASLAFVQGIHREPVNSLHKWPVTQKMFPFDDVIVDYYPNPRSITTCLCTVHILKQIKRMVIVDVKLWYYLQFIRDMVSWIMMLGQMILMRDAVTSGNHGKSPNEWWKNHYWPQSCMVLFLTYFCVIKRYFSENNSNQCTVHHQTGIKEGCCDIVLSYRCDIFNRLFQNQTTTRNAILWWN